MNGKRMKYIIDIPNELAEASARYWNETTNMTLVPYTEPDRKAIEDEVWKFAKKVRLKEFFDDNHNLHPYLDYFDSYQDAKAKHEALKKQKEEEEEMKEVTALAEKIGIHKLYSMVKEIRGE